MLYGIQIHILVVVLTYVLTSNFDIVGMFVGFQEEKRLLRSDFSHLLHNSVFNKSLLACSVVVVMASYCNHCKHLPHFSHFTCLTQQRFVRTSKFQPFYCQMLLLVQTSCLSPNTCYWPDTLCILTIMAGTDCTQAVQERSSDGLDVAHL